ncbi:MAG: helix-turn-helix domain-containing protein [Lachnospiraceae bacterium]
MSNFVVWEVRLVAVKCNLSTLMGRYRYNIQDVCQKAGLSRGTVSSLYHDKTQRIDYETLEKLCKLFDCQTSHILEVYLEKEE